MRIIAGVQASGIWRGGVVFPGIAHGHDGGVIGLGDHTVPFAQTGLHVAGIGAFVTMLVAGPVVGMARPGFIKENAGIGAFEADAPAELGGTLDHISPVLGIDFGKGWLLALVLKYYHIPVAGIDGGLGGGIAQMPFECLATGGDGSDDGHRIANIFDN